MKQVHAGRFNQEWKIDPVQLKGYFKQGLLANKEGRFASTLLLFGRGRSEASKKVNLSFKSASPKPHLNRTGSVLHSQFKELLRKGEERAHAKGVSMCLLESPFLETLLRTFLRTLPPPKNP